jgi:predicted Zn finger-like uncharacterized protein
MIIQCQGCAAKYFLPEDRVPHDPLKVSCPKCKAVFTLVPRHEPVGATVAPRAATPIEPVAPPTPVDEVPAVPEAPSVPDETPVAPQAPARPRRRGGSKEDRAKRLARVLVSDILCYNREKRDQALQDGTLMATLSEEIKKSWELYKEKVGPEVAQSTNHFKEALNEILADGQEVF